MKTHHKKKGDRVCIYNGTDKTGKPELEGIATIITTHDTANFYKVRFDGQGEGMVSRFVNTDGSENVD